MADRNNPMDPMRINAQNEMNKKLLESLRFICDMLICLHFTGH